MCIVVGHLAFLSTKLSADHPGVSSATVSSDMSEAKFSGLTLGRTTAARTQHHVLKWGCLACFKHLEVSECVCVCFTIHSELRISITANHVGRFPIAGTSQLEAEDSAPSVLRCCAACRALLEVLRP